MRSKRPSFWGDLLSAQVGAAQQGKTENLVFNKRSLHDLALQVQFPCCNSIFTKVALQAQNQAQRDIDHYQRTLRCKMKDSDAIEFSIPSFHHFT
jgi:hypothetical protein